ncbi:MAG: hypothetical protein GAK31_00929 [Stenotrophomonas maltophilia]|uniref:Phage tail protein n=1 Tax=Stenotrophomonas maltophilia TaxID=40324 RepID=A0A7V8FKD9_STEMA|nr:MAG: hypothetical protein GAK31_00929 [Stenotrophomonas maltophilia]
MAQTYSSKAGDMADEVAWLQYGQCNADVLRLVLDANHGLADHGPVLPAGIRIVLPDLPTPSRARDSVSLWD